MLLRAGKILQVPTLYYLYVAHHFFRADEQEALMRRAATIIAVGVLAMIVVIGVFLATLDINRYRRTIEAELSKRLGRNVKAW